MLAPRSKVVVFAYIFDAVGAPESSLLYNRTRTGTCVEPVCPSIKVGRERGFFPAQGSARERAPVSVPSVSLVDDTRSFRLSGLHPFVLRAKDPALQYARLALTQNVRASCCSSRVPEPEEDPLEPRCVWTRALLIRAYAALAQQTVCIDLVSCRRKAIVTSWTEAERTISFAICRSSSGERRRRMHPRLAKGSMSKSSRVV